MQREENQIIDSQFVKGTLTKRRRSLLPWWIKLFTWIFLIFGAIAPFAVILGLLGMSFQLELYGYQTDLPLSVTGIGLTFIFIIKGVTALGLWIEKDWAITLGQIDAIIGIIVCSLPMILPSIIGNQPDFDPSFRLELLLLIPFLIKLSKIKKEWLNGHDKQQE